MQHLKIQWSVQQLCFQECQFLFVNVFIVFKSVVYCLKKYSVVFHKCLLGHVHMNDLPLPLKRLFNEKYAAVVLSESQC